jgi:hypothetical protein
MVAGIQKQNLYSLDRQMGQLSAEALTINPIIASKFCAYLRSLIAETHRYKYKNSEDLEHMESRRVMSDHLPERISVRMANAQERGQKSERANNFWLRFHSWRCVKYLT